MRTLLAILLVGGLIAGFFAFTALLPRWRTGYEKLTLVRGVVEPTGAQRATGPVSIYVALFQGRPRPADLSDTPIDDDGPEREERGRFEVGAGPDDGSTFFLRASVELATFEVFCADVALPPVELVDGEWVETRTGRPLEPLRITPTSAC